MKKLFRVNEIRLIVGLALTGLLCVAYALKAPGNDNVLNGPDDQEVAPLVLQTLDYTENPVDIPNPDRGAYRGRWQNISPDSVNETNSPFGITLEVNHGFRLTPILFCIMEDRCRLLKVMMSKKPQSIMARIRTLTPDVGGTGSGSSFNIIYVF